MARPEHPARRLGARASRRRRHRRADRALDAQARADDVYAVNDRRRRLHAASELAPTQAPLLNGEAGVSRKGAAPQAASYYYSLPHLRVRGSIARNGRRDAVHGRGVARSRMVERVSRERRRRLGLDRHQLRRRRGAHGLSNPRRDSMSRAGQAGRCGRPTAPFRSSHPIRCASSRCAPGYRRAPALVIRSNGTCSAGTRELDLKPLMDDQENDTRLSTGAVYWEGAVQAYESGHRRRPRLP